MSKYTYVSNSKTNEPETEDSNCNFGPTYVCSIFYHGGVTFSPSKALCLIHGHQSRTCFRFKFSVILNHVRRPFIVRFSFLEERKNMRSNRNARMILENRK